VKDLAALYANIIGSIEFLKIFMEEVAEK